MLTWLLDVMFGQSAYLFARPKSLPCDRITIIQRTIHGFDMRLKFTFIANFDLIITLL